MNWRPHWLVVLLALVLAVLLGGFLWGRNSRTPSAGLATTASTTSTSIPTTSLPTTTTTTLSFAQLYSTDSSGVIRIEGTSCDGGDVGTGFLVAPDLVLTVAHVVAGTNTIALRSGAAQRTLARS